MFYCIYQHVLSSYSQRRTFIFVLYTGKWDQLNWWYIQDLVKSSLEADSLDCRVPYEAAVTGKVLSYFALASV